MAIKVCLDAGHIGKYNRSPVVPAYYESDFNWKLYVKLKKYLESYGIQVIGTRASQDEEMSTKPRGRASKGCDLFLSLHANWAERESADHVVIYEMLDKKRHDLAVKLAAAIKEIMGTKEKYDIRTKASDSGGEWYGVLSGCAQVGNPYGFIVEHSFYSNTAMANWMMSDSNIDKLARIEAEVIANYFNISAPNQPVAPSVTLNPGDLVSINSGAKYTTGSSIPSWVRKQNWYIKSISGDIAIIDQNEAKNNNINSPVYLKDLTLVAAKVIETAPAVKEEPVPAPEIVEPTIEPEVEAPVVDTTPVKPNLDTPLIELKPEPEIEEFTPPVEIVDEEDDDNGPEAEIDNNPVAASIGEAILKLLVEFVITPLINWVKGLFSKGK